MSTEGLSIIRIYGWLLSANEVQEIVVDKHRTLSFPPKRNCTIADGQVTTPQDKDNAEYMTQNYYKNIGDRA